MINLLSLAYAQYSQINQRWISAGRAIICLTTQTLLTHLAQKIPFINSKKNCGCQQCAHKY